MIKEKEIWLPIKGFEGWYEVSNLGNVRRMTRQIVTGATLKQQLLTQYVSRGGYYRVTLSSPIDNKQRKYLVHRLVACAFVDGYAEGLVVNHIDENKTNNVASNLEWCSPKENTNYGTGVLRRKKKREKPVYQCNSDGEIIANYESVSKAANATGIDRRLISQCLVGRTHSAGGFKWAYSPKVVAEDENENIENKYFGESFMPLEGEVWKVVNIDGEIYPNYEISNKGRLRTIPRKGYSSQYRLCHPYYLRGRAQMALKKDGRKFKTSIARIVAFAFCPGYKPGFQANHIDENPLNDNADNLEWVSCQDNINYGTRTQKVREKRSIRVAQMDDAGNIIKIFDSISEATRLVGGRIKDVCDGKREKAKGFRWKYVDKLLNYNEN